MNRFQIETQMRLGLRVVGRMEDMKNAVSRVRVEEDPVTGDLLFLCGQDVRRITATEMINAVENETVPRLIDIVREYVRCLSDMHPSGAAL